MYFSWSIFRPEYALALGIHLHTILCTPKTGHVTSDEPYTRIRGSYRTPPKLVLTRMCKESVNYIATRGKVITEAYISRSVGEKWIIQYPGTDCGSQFEMLDWFPRIRLIYFASTSLRARGGKTARHLRKKKLTLRMIFIAKSHRPTFDHIYIFFEFLFINRKYCKLLRECVVYIEARIEFIIRKTILRIEKAARAFA